MTRAEPTTARQERKTARNAGEFKGKRFQKIPEKIREILTNELAALKTGKDSTDPFKALCWKLATRKGKVADATENDSGGKVYTFGYKLGKGLSVGLLIWDIGMGVPSYGGSITVLKGDKEISRRSLRFGVE
ncbi:hypothetical protein KJ780_05015 [Candidatus Micrarchaeota archaeon]|nr:hypothetical protein [Candidatus Micrarchaeota archaeon]